MHSALLQGRIWSAVTRFTVVTLSTPATSAAGSSRSFSIFAALSALTANSVAVSKTGVPRIAVALDISLFALRCIGLPGRAAYQFSAVVLVFGQ